jgi:hypothetical protein|tara:strand:- start:368 stop:589 length:222 start_codon:yes stop_codon:yes gene_type:complete
MPIENLLISFGFMALNVFIVSLILENWQLRKLHSQGKSTQPNWPGHYRCSVQLNLKPQTEYQTYAKQQSRQPC